MAAGGLAESGSLNLITSIDERSAAFLGLGISSANGKATVIITTSGTAVANLLPAAIEADRSCQPLIFLTADRPERLKNCGANQTVNQEDFLKSVCRCLKEGPREGFHLCSEKTNRKLVDRVWLEAHKFPGPVHFNISFEEPLHASFLEQQSVWSKCSGKGLNVNSNSLDVFDLSQEKFQEEIPKLDPFSPGIVIAGPWRGLSKDIDPFKEALKDWQSISGWPIFADPLSGIDDDQEGLISFWELLISSDFLSATSRTSRLNILRLGPLPSSRILANWLTKMRGNQVLISEGDKRYLDPLRISSQWSYGLNAWVKNIFNSDSMKANSRKNKSIDLLNQLVSADSYAKNWISQKLNMQGQITEPALAHWLPRRLPLNIQIMLSASSPIRDWISFGGKETLSRRCFGFRGASGIDGTLSLGMGLSIANGPTVLVTGDLALLHDSNGWLFSNSPGPPIVVLLIDNGGGGIFQQLEIEKFVKGNLEDLFVMPQLINPLALASCYDIPFRQISLLEDLEIAFEWAISKNKPVLLRVCTSSYQDNKLRNYLKEGFKGHLHKIIQNKEIKS